MMYEGNPFAVEQYLESRSYQQFCLNYVQYSGAGHLSVVQPAIRFGLRWFFEE